METQTNKAKYWTIKWGKHDTVIITEDGGVACINTEYGRVDIELYQNRMPLDKAVSTDDLMESLNEGKMYTQELPLTEPVDKQLAEASVLEATKIALNWLMPMTQFFIRVKLPKDWTEINDTNQFIILT